jgi:hypothetical protein
VKSLAETCLGAVNKLVKKAIEDGIGDDLIKPWFDVTYDRPALAVIQEDPLIGGRIYKQIAIAVASLATLEKAAQRAAENARSGPGRPKGPSVLPRSEVIIGLAAAYRRSTGLKPTASKVFTTFAQKCLTALSGKDINYNSLREAVKRAKREAIMYAAANPTSPSPFA